KAPVVREAFLTGNSRQGDFPGRAVNRVEAEHLDAIREKLGKQTQVQAPSTLLVMNSWRLQNQLRSAAGHRYTHQLGADKLIRATGRLHVPSSRQLQVNDPLTVGA